jgi:hypothetical protein
MEKYGSLIEGAMVGANMRTELDIIEEVELLLCPTWVGGEGRGVREVGGTQAFGFSFVSLSVFVHRAKNLSFVCSKQESRRGP